MSLGTELLALGITRYFAVPVPDPPAAALPIAVEHGWVGCSESWLDENPLVAGATVAVLVAVPSGRVVGHGLYLGVASEAHKIQKVLRRELPARWEVLLRVGWIGFSEHCSAVKDIAAVPAETCALLVESNDPMILLPSVGMGLCVG